jgi:hypothetical protein
VTQSFWNVDSSGLGSDGSTSFSAGGLGESTAHMMAKSTFCASGNCTGGTSGFDFTPGTGFWGTIDGLSYPYLLNQFPNPPLVISGIAAGTINANVMLAANGSLLPGSGVYTGANGFYYYLATNTQSAGSTILAYLNNGSLSDAVSRLSAGSSAIAGLNLLPNTVSIGDNQTQSLNNSVLSAAQGNLTNGIYYSVLGNNLSLNNGLSLYTSANTTYAISGNITTSGNQTYAGPITLSNNPILKIIGTNSGITIGGGINNSSTQNLQLVGNAGNSNSFNLAGPFNLANLTVIGGSGGNNSLTVGNADQTWNITGANTGLISNIVGSSIPGTFSFYNIANLTGGSGNDNFVLGAAGSVTSLNGGGGTNILSAANANGILAIRIANSVYQGSNLSVANLNNIQTFNGIYDLDTATQIANLNLVNNLEYIIKQVIEGTINSRSGSDNKYVFQDEDFNPINVSGLQLTVDPLMPVKCTITKNHQNHISDYWVNCQ